MIYENVREHYKSYLKYLVFGMFLNAKSKLSKLDQFYKNCKLAFQQSLPKNV